MIQERGYLILNPNVGKAGVGDSATIIQYPDGNYQQVGLRENQILDLSDPNSMIYQTDTSPGTSGSPVFNDQWQVIALHSAGVAKKDAAGNYIDKSGQPIPVVDGKVDSTRVVWVSNSGIRVSAIDETDHGRCIHSKRSKNSISFITVLFGCKKNGSVFLQPNRTNPSRFPI